MGFNLISGCHKCKTQVFHWRGEENDTILPFYIAHKLCAREDINNVQTIMDNNGNDQYWCQNERDGGYAEDALQKSVQ